MALAQSNAYSQGAYTAVNTISSVSYTVPAGTDVLEILVPVDAANTTAPLPDLVEHLSVAATLVSAIPTDAGGTGQLAFHYRILNPTPGTGNLRVRHPTIQFGVDAICISCDGTLTLTNSAFNYANSTSPSVSIASASGDLTLYFLTVNNVDGALVSETGGQTVRSEGGTIANAMHQLSTEVSSGSSNSATWTVSSAQRWSTYAVNYHETSQTITSINNGNPLTVGQTNIPSVTTGYTGLPTSITTDKSGVACSNIGGTTNAPTFDLSGWVEGQQYPSLPASVLFTFTRSAESANASQTVTVPSGYITQTFAGAITGDDTYVTDGLASFGHAVEGADFYYVPYDDLFIYADGKISVTDDGVFSAWLRPISGTTAGKMYFFEITVVDGSVTEINGLTSIGLTSIGLTSTGLTSVGL